jgi:S-adenosylmethionine decarboxylase proenzyme
MSGQHGKKMIFCIHCQKFNILHVHSIRRILDFSTASQGKRNHMNDTGEFFEGVEKRVEIRFSLGTNSPDGGLCSFKRAVWDELCALCRCEIIHHTTLPGFKSFVLSESSLFVFPDMIMIKTCGTTIPLNGVDYIVREAGRFGISAIDMLYSRADFLMPALQEFPHNSLRNELEFLERMTVDDRVVPGKSSILGDPSGRHWLIHRKSFTHQCDAPDSIDTPEHRQGFSEGPKISVDIIMTGIDREVCKGFYQSLDRSDEENQNFMANLIKPILPEFLNIEGKCYDPCGYSANGHEPLGSNPDRFFTVHVTPEEDFSYASFEASFYQSTVRSRSDLFGLETDVKMMRQIETMVINALRVFAPKSAMVTMISSDESVHTKELATRLSVESSKDYVAIPGPYTSGNLLGEDIVASSVYYSGVSSGNTGTKPPGLS